MITEELRAIPFAAMEEILTVEEVANKLKVDIQVVRRLLRAGEIRGKRVGRSWRIQASAVDDYMRSPAPDEHPPRRPK